MTDWAKIIKPGDELFVSGVSARTWQHTPHTITVISVDPRQDTCPIRATQHPWPGRPEGELSGWGYHFDQIIGFSPEITAETIEFAKQNLSTIEQELAMSEIRELRERPPVMVPIGQRCDRCGKTDEEVTFNMISPVRFEFDPGEEAEILVQGDICYDCFEESGDELRRIAETLRTILPNGSWRSSTMMDWEPTGIYDDDDG